MRIFWLHNLFIMLLKNVLINAYIFNIFEGFSGNFNSVVAIQ